MTQTFGGEVVGDFCFLEDPDPDPALDPPPASLCLTNLPYFERLSDQATVEGDERTVQLLLDYGATVDLPNGNGQLIGNVWGDSFSTGVLPRFRDQLYADLAAEPPRITALVDTTRFSGVQDAPAAVAHMLAGRNVGKVVLHISEH